MYYQNSLIGFVGAQGFEPRTLPMYRDALNQTMYP